MNIRKPDEKFTDCLYESFLSDTDRRIFLNNIDEQIYSKALPNELDDLDTLTIKKVFMEEEIQPQLFNFNIHSETYDNVYKELISLINEKKVSKIDDVTYETEKEEEKIDRPLSRDEVRQARIKFYSK